MSLPAVTPKAIRQPLISFFLDRINTPVQLICGGNDLRCLARDSMDARDKLVEL